MSPEYTIHAISSTNEDFEDKLIEEYAYVMAEKMQEMIDGYMRLYVRPKPRWCPDRLYRWFLLNFLYLNRFKK